MRTAPPPRHVYIVLAAAVGAVSAAAILVRLATGITPVTLAFWRTLTVAILLIPAARPVPPRDALLAVLAGAFLAFHFWTWFASLALTSVLRSTLFVCLGPIWLGLAEWAILSRRPPGRYWLGIAVAVAGVGMMSSHSGGEGTVAGDSLAVLGGLLSAAYLFVGHQVRQRLSVGPYTFILSVSAAAVLLAATLLTGSPLWGFPRSTWLAVAALALGPQLVGHNGFNYALRHLGASVVSTAILLEPVGAAFLAALLLRELPAPTDAAGAAVVLAGVFLALKSTAPSPNPIPETAPPAIQSGLRDGA